MAEESGERTEQATEQRMKEVREKGKLSRSQDLTAWAIVAGCAVMMPSTISAVADAATGQVFTISAVAADPTPEHALEALGEGLASVLPALSGMFVVALLCVVVAARAQGPVHFRKFTGKFEQFNLLAGTKRLFGTQSMWQGAKTLLKTAVISGVLYVVVQSIVPILLSGGVHPVDSVVSIVSDKAADLIRIAVAAGVLLSVADVFVVMRRNRKQTRMTKKEVKDEHKRSEGDPHVKSQRRSIQMAASRNRMIAAVGSADTVLVNPTHVAIALKYEEGKHAPRVVARGKGVIAARIREEAEKNDVPMVRDIPLARTLYKACKVGQDVPIELYGQVAIVLAFVMRLRTRGRPSGIYEVGGDPQ